MPRSIDETHQEQAFVANGVGSCATRVHIYAGPLLRIGVEQILDDLHFVVADSAPEGVSQEAGFDSSAAELFIVDEKYRPNGISKLIGELKAGNAEARIIVLADRFDFNTIVSARHAGADGFCLTTSSRDVLIHSIELVMLGEVVVPSELIMAFIEGSVRSIDCPPRPPADKLDDDAPRRPLSSREIEVLGWLKEGAPNKVIARRLDMAEATVKVHVKAILRKIGVHNRSQAAIWAAYHLPLEAEIRSAAL